LKAVGNSVVPQVVALVGRAILEAHRRFRAEAVAQDGSDDAVDPESFS